MLLLISGMSDLAERLIEGMREYGVELSFDGELLLLHPRIFVYTNGLDFTEIEKPGVEVSLGKMVRDGYHEFSLIYHSDKEFWQKIARVYPGAFQDYQPNLLAAAFANIIERSDNIDIVRMPSVLKSYLNCDHLLMLNNKGQYQELIEKLDNYIPIYKELDIESDGFWDSLKI